MICLFDEHIFYGRVFLHYSSENFGEKFKLFICINLLVYG